MINDATSARPPDPRSASVNQAARQVTKPPPRTVGHNGQRGRDTISQEQQQLYCFSKDATHNEWTTSHLSIIHAVSYYWSVSLAVNIVFPNDW